MKSKKDTTKKKLDLKIISSIGCMWCGNQIREDEYNEHPRNCVYYQEFLRQII